MSRLRAHPYLVLWLTAVWVGLWGTVTPANVLGGLAVAAVLVARLPLNEVESEGVVRPLGVLRFIAYFAQDLVKASLQVAVLVLRPRGALRQAVIAVDVRGESDRLLTLLVDACGDRPSAFNALHLIARDWVRTAPDAEAEAHREHVFGRLHRAIDTAFGLTNEENHR